LQLKNEPKPKLYLGKPRSWEFEKKEGYEQTAKLA
jgi:hypothetical protein